MTTDPVPAISYASPSIAAAGGSQVAAGFWIMFGGLALIFLGGCFYIGIMALVTPVTVGFSGTTAAKPLTWEQHLFMVALYFVAVTCFVSGAWLMSLGVRKLLAVGR